MADKRRRVTFKEVRGPGRDVVQLEWPGTGHAFGLLLLRCDEVQEAHFAAVERFNRKAQPMDTAASIGEFIREKELQEVHRMLLEPAVADPKLRLFKSPDEARAALDLSEVAWVQARQAEEVRKVLVARGLREAVEELEQDDDAD